MHKPPRGSTAVENVEITEMTLNKPVQFRLA